MAKLWLTVKSMILSSSKSDMGELHAFLGKLGLLSIDGFEFRKSLGGRSALSSLYCRGDEKIVFKFLISPRNDVELERFKQEYSVLCMNSANSTRNESGFIAFDYKFIGPPTSYPLPVIRYPLTQRLSGIISFFGYAYEDGVLLSELDTSSYTHEEKILLLYRISSGLSYFNQTGYSHRDMHPDNILLLNDYRMARYHWEDNDPRVKFLDMGSCQRANIEYDWMYRIERNLDEDLVFTENNKRIVSSFMSMPPDFLSQGEKTENYDTWAFGIYAYKLFFGEYPFVANSINDLTLLRENREFGTRYKDNLNSLSVGEKLILNHILSPNGKERPSISTIVRLFSWLVQRGDEFQNPEFINRVIHNEGFDPNHDPVDNLY